ncbi:insulinase family protein [Patescibacteria group bacterium]|nr:insulinase family protein [Patescibacteria group bacterium]
MLEHQLHQLKSGLTVITIPMPSVQSLTVMALANTGSRYEQPSQYGIAHFFEHIVFKGTAKYPEAQDLAQAVDSVGANFNAFTSKEYTGYYVQVASKHFDLALDVVSDMLLTPQLRQEDIDREKGVIIEEMNMYADMPASDIGDRFEEMAFSGNGLSHKIVGTKDTVNSITTQNFSDFLQTWYGLNNLVVVVAGDASVVGKAQTLTQIEQMFSKTGNKQSEISHERLNSILAEDKAIFVNKKTEQSHFTFGWPSIERLSARRHTLTLLSSIIGGNMSSRLFSEVREKRGLCYYVHSDLTQYHEGGLFGGSAGVDPSRVEEAIKVSLDEFRLLASGEKKVTAEELKRAKEYVIGKTVLGLEDSESVAQFYGLRQLLHGKVENPDDFIAKIRQVELEDVQSLASDLIVPGQLRFGLIGSFNEDKIREIIKNY